MAKDKMLHKAKVEQKIKTESEKMSDHKKELGLDAILAVLLFVFPFGADQMEIPHNFWVGVGCWTASLALAVRIVWIFPYWENISRRYKAFISIVLLVAALVLAWHPVRSAYQSMFATQLGMQLMSQISGQANSPVTGAILTLRNVGDEADEHVYIRVFMPQSVKNVTVDNPDRVQIVSGPHGKDWWRDFAFELSAPELAGQEMRVIKVEMAPPAKPGGKYIVQMSSHRCKGACKSVLIFGPYVVSSP
jgi:hypothetical protein